MINLMPKGSWAGSEADLKDLIDIALMSQKATETKGLMGLAFNDEEEEERNRLLSVVGSTGVISISGSLVNNDSYWNRYFGVTGYPEIKDAFIEAANDEAVTNIVMSIDSGGGVVKGVFELAEFIKQVDESIKPVQTHNAGMMASAAYLLGSQGRDVSAGEMTQTGSIGVIMIHQEYTEALKKEGVKVNVIRAGDHKALVNPYEKLTDEARAELQKDADYIHGKFIETVASGRELSYTNVKENMADGRTFYAEEALRLGLVDNISSIDKLVAELNDAGSGNNGNYIAQEGDSVDTSLESSSAGEIKMAKKKATLSAENQALLASGVPLENLDTSADDQTPKPEASTEEGITDEHGTGSGAEASTEETVTEEENAEPTANEAPAATELVSFLKDQNTELNAKQTEMSLELSQVKAELALVNGSQGSLEQIVVDACTRLSIGLGQSGSDYSHLKGDALVTQFGSLNKEFCKLFPVGGQVSTEAEPAKEITNIHKNRASAVSTAKI